MSPSQKVTLHAAAKAVQHATPNADGLVQIESWKLCQTVGQSKDTFLDNLTYLSEHVGVLRKQAQRVVSEDGTYTTNLYIAPTEHLAHPEQYRVEKPRNHGGERLTCPHCHSDRLQKKVIVTCMGCGAILNEKASQVNKEETNEPSIPETTILQKGQLADPAPSFFDSSPSTLTTDITRNKERQVADPEKIGVEVNKQETVSPRTAQVSEIPSDPVRLMEKAAALFVQIAGTESVHIEMSARGPAKYYEVKREFSLADARAHLAGTKTKGAMLRRSDGTTRALCYDADTDDDWQRLREAAHLLAHTGYIPLVEDSPAGRGGHLWIIFTDLVEARSAQQHVCEIAPMLQEIKEYWPSLGNHKVRLPGGKYVKPGFSQQCKLYDATGSLVAETRQDAARALLSMQTSSALIPILPSEPPLTEFPQRVTCSNPEPIASAPRESATTSPNGTATVATSQPKNHPYRWFQFTPQQVAAWYNERHSIKELLPPERNHMGLAHWRGERTASVGYTPDGHGWVDFGGSARRSDGKQDGGDALELLTRISNQSKPEVMRQAARELIKEARTALESAARAGQPLPTWVQDILTPAGQAHYQEMQCQTVATPFQSVSISHAGNTSEHEALPASCSSAQTKDQETPQCQNSCLADSKEDASCCQASWAWSEATQRYLCWACKRRKAAQARPTGAMAPMTFYD